MAADQSNPRGLGVFGGWMLKLVRPRIWYLLGVVLAGPPLSAQGLQAPQPQNQKEVLIERIDIRGNRRMKEEDIRSYIQSRPGDVYDEERLQFDLRSIYKEAKWFENIEVTSMDGDTGK